MDEQILRVFLSQADPVTAQEFDRLITPASSGTIQLFNTAVIQHGLSPGDHLSNALASEITNSSMFLSVWSPSAIAHPAWMAWELGVAAALEKPVKIVRVLGAEVEELPLGLSAHYAPDVGRVDEFIAFCDNLRREHPGTQLDVSRVREDFVPAGLTASPLWSREDYSSPIRLSIRGGRVLIENITDQERRDVSAASDVADDSAFNLARPVNRALERHGRRLEPRQRVVVAPTELSGDPLPESDSDLSLRFEWISPGLGRAHASVSVRHRA